MSASTASLGYISKEQFILHAAKHEYPEILGEYMWEKISDDTKWKCATEHADKIPDRTVEFGHGGMTLVAETVIDDPRFGQCINASTIDVVVEHGSIENAGLEATRMLTSYLEQLKATE